MEEKKSEVWREKRMYEIYCDEWESEASRGQSRLWDLFIVHSFILLSCINSINIWISPLWGGDRHGHAPVRLLLSLNIGEIIL